MCKRKQAFAWELGDRDQANIGKLEGGPHLWDSVISDQAALYVMRIGEQCWS